MASIKSKNPIANVGDVVTIVEATGCRFGYDRPMSRFIGLEAFVTGIRWSSSVGSYVYILNVDEGRYMWCDKCIVRIDDTEIEESDVSIDILFEDCVK